MHEHKCVGVACGACVSLGKRFVDRHRRAVVVERAKCLSSELAIRARRDDKRLRCGVWCKVYGVKTRGGEGGEVHQLAWLA